MWRSICEAMVLIKQTDPKSAVTAYALRNMCKSERIETLKAGTKILVNLQSLGKLLKIDFMEVVKNEN